MLLQALDQWTLAPFNFEGGPLFLVGFGLLSKSNVHGLGPGEFHVGYTATAGQGGANRVKTLPNYERD